MLPSQQVPVDALPSMPDRAASIPLTCSPRTWRLVLAYDGTSFQGWQVQPGVPTVQGTLQAAVREIFGVSVLPQGSGRTDAGVHADGQVVSLTLPLPITAERLQRVLNRRLPASIRVVSASPAAPDFHPRADVLSKRYEYRIFPRRSIAAPGEAVCPPALARYVWDCRWPLRLEAMQQAAGVVTGTHDFSSFAAHDPDRAERISAAGGSNVRTIHSSIWAQRDGLLVYSVSGSGFLHHMVRNLVGTFVEVGRGRMSPAAVAGVLAARSRTAAGPTAPPQGLFLAEVVYAGDAAASGSADDVAAPLTLAGLSA